MAVLAAARPLARATGAGEGRLHWLTLAASAWLLCGLFWDGWAHGYGLPDSFWTVWHAAFYSGYAALAVVIGGATILRRPAAASWREAIPDRYGWAVVGAIVFGLGGAFDAIWHTLFGIEASTEALLSPSHLILATGMVLMVSAPLRAAWAKPPASLSGALPAVLSLTATFSLFTFMTMFGGAYSTHIAQGRDAFLRRHGASGCRRTLLDSAPHGPRPRGASRRDAPARLAHPAHRRERVRR